MTEGIIAKTDCEAGECWVRIEDVLVCTIWKKAYAEAIVEGLNRLAKAEDEEAKKLVAALHEAQKPSPKRQEPVATDPEPKPKKRVKHKY